LQKPTNWSQPPERPLPVVTGPATASKLNVVQALPTGGTKTDACYYDLKYVGSNVEIIEVCSATVTTPPVTTTTKDAAGNVTGTTTTPGTSTTTATKGAYDPSVAAAAAAEPKPVQCGLSPLPACVVNVDESKLPAVYAADKYAQVSADYKTAVDAARTTVAGTADKGFLSGWSVLFSAPAVTTCSPIVLPNGMTGQSMGSLNPCPVVDGMRAVMAYIWALGGFWLCLGMVKRTF